MRLGVRAEMAYRMAEIPVGARQLELDCKVCTLLAATSKKREMAESIERRKIRRSVSLDCELCPCFVSEHSKCEIVAAGAYEVSDHTFNPPLEKFNYATTALV